MIRLAIIIVIIILLLFIYRRSGDILVGIISGTIVYLVAKYYPNSKNNTPKNGGSELNGAKLKKLGNFREKEIYRILNDMGYSSFHLNQHPDWFTYNDSLSGKKIQLELDLYSEQYAMAIEYNGPQHYSEKYWDSFYKYAKYVQNSLIKPEICRENGIDLIIIPFTVDPKNLKKYIKSRILESKIVRDSIGMTEKDWKVWKSSEKYMAPVKEPKIEKLKEIKRAIISRELNEIYE